jgi:hypothetical protein
MIIGLEPGVQHLLQLVQGSSQSFITSPQRETERKYDQHQVTSPIDWPIIGTVPSNTSRTRYMRFAGSLCSGIQFST